MKALIKSRREPGIWLGELPKPEPGPNDVLIRMRKTAICGTDIHIWQWDDWAARTIPVPMQIGHEYCGEIVAIGSEVRGLAVGDRVSGEGHITCGHCRNCRAGRRHLCRNTQGVGVNRPGCFAEYMVLPASNVFRLPPACPAHAREAVEVGARCLWLQLGIASREAGAIAHAAGLDVVMNRCLAVEAMRG